MADKAITLFCIAAALDGEGGTFKPGEKITCDTKAEAGQLIATGRFSDDEEAAKRAVEAAKKKTNKEASKVVDLEKQNAELSKQNAAVLKRLEALEKAAKK